MTKELFRPEEYPTCHCGRQVRFPEKEGGYFLCNGCLKDMPVCDCLRLTATEALVMSKRKCETRMIPTDTLSKSFYISSGKTLKLEVKPETKLVEAVEDSRKYLETQDCPHSRIEFKFGHCYIVIARLRN